MKKISLFVALLCVAALACESNSVKIEQNKSASTQQCVKPCDPGFECRESHCVLVDKQGAQDNQNVVDCTKQPCKAGFACLSGRCVQESQNQGCLDVKCAESELCENGSCRPKKGCEIDPCTADSLCIEGNCVRLSSCKATPCPDNEICDGDKCRPKKGCEIDPCTPDSRCVNGACEKV